MSAPYVFYDTVLLEGPRISAGREWRLFREPLGQSFGNGYKTEVETNLRCCRRLDSYLWTPEIESFEPRYLSARLECNAETFSPMPLDITIRMRICDRNLTSNVVTLRDLNATGLYRRGAVMRLHKAPRIYERDDIDGQLTAIKSFDLGGGAAQVRIRVALHCWPIAARKKPAARIPVAAPQAAMSAPDAYTKVYAPDAKHVQAIQRDLLAGK